ncbi:hypothetical protein HPB50_009740 [Hyalomma asiaticum]|uniref:Uncharacterized protein n=1 Tax=Hyalomma asiaticum TaxID=266040 RepID=A0ACB7TFP2_HYAAI|nr:hypothetical protein HPB50_009740 [Hyalomma asiaticum]
MRARWLPRFAGDGVASRGSTDPVGPVPLEDADEMFAQLDNGNLSDVGDSEDEEDDDFIFEEAGSDDSLKLGKLQMNQMRNKRAKKHHGAGKLLGSRQLILVEFAMKMNLFWAVLSLVLAWLSSVPDRHTSPVPPFRSFGFDYGSRTNASFLDANNFLDATSVVQLPPGYPAPASASSVVRVDLNCRPPDTLFSGHGNSIGSVVLNQHVFAMQGWKIYPIILQTK